MKDPDKVLWVKLLAAIGSIPGDDIDDWYRMYLLYQLGAQESSSGIPMIFGTDSVHGNMSVYHLPSSS